jgi:hypothetical protein
MIFKPAGYAYQAEAICPACMETIARLKVVIDDLPQCGPAEKMLDNWALRAGIDRDDEISFDSNDFPKVMTLQMAEHDREWALFEGDSAPRCSCGHDFVTDY